MNTSDFTTNDLMRFFSRVNFTENMDDCWEWTGLLNDSGYGRFWFKKGCLAHRIAWLIAYGELQDALKVCHHCDNPKCCNPKHLFIGTTGDNNSDRHKKGRSKGGSLPGSKNGNSKLTWDIVREIRRRYKTERISMRKLAKQYGVYNSAIERIIDNKNWVE